MDCPFCKRKINLGATIKREDVVKKLIEHDIEQMLSEHDVRSAISEILELGVIGYADYTNKELEHEYNNIYRNHKNVSVITIEDREITNSGREYTTVGVFQSKRTGEIYKVKSSISQLTDHLELTCNCKGGIYYKSCKHITHVEENGFNYDVNNIIEL